MAQFIYGPAQDDNVFLATNYKNGFYILRPDPNSKFPPYFGEANINDVLNLRLTVTEGKYYLKTSTGYGFVQDSYQGTAIPASSSNGSFTYKYLTNVTPNTALLYGVSIQIITNAPLTFKVKSPEQELADQANSGNSAYLPSYSGSINNYFLVPFHAYDPTYDCIGTTNGTLFAYSGDSRYTHDWFSNLEWCLSNKQIQPCLNNQPCGTCFGPCSENKECIPNPDGNLQCRSPGNLKTPIYQEIWFWILIGGAILLIIIVIVFLVFLFR